MIPLCLGLNPRGHRIYTRPGNTWSTRTGLSTSALRTPTSLPLIILKRGTSYRYNSIKKIGRPLRSPFIFLCYSKIRKGSIEPISCEEISIFPNNFTSIGSPVNSQTSLNSTEISLAKATRCSASIST